VHDTGVHTVSPQVRNDRRYAHNSYRAIKEASACNMDKDRMKMRVGTPKSQAC